MTSKILTLIRLCYKGILLSNIRYNLFNSFNKSNLIMIYVPLKESTDSKDLTKTSLTIKVFKAKHVYSLLLLGSFALISGCDSSSEYESGAQMESIQSTEQAAEPQTLDNSSSNVLEVDSLSDTSEQTLGSQTADIQIAGKKLLVTASANFKVKDVIKSSNAIESLTRQQGGYVALSDISNNPQDSRSFVQGDKNITITTYYRQAEMIVRVPRVNVTTFLDQVQQQVVFLNEHQFSAQDVTLDIYREQLAGQLNNDMAQELGQQRLNSDDDKDQSSNVDAITATYAARRQQELAQLERMDIEDKVKYSTINLTFAQPDISYKEITQNLEVLVDAEQPSFGEQVQQAFKEGWEMLRAVALGIIQLWWLVVLASVFYLIYRVLKNLYRRFFGETLRIKKLKSESTSDHQHHKSPPDKQKIRLDDNSDLK